MTVVGTEVAASAAVEDAFVGPAGPAAAAASASKDDRTAVGSTVHEDATAVGSTVHEDATAVGSAVHDDAELVSAEVQQARHALQVLARRVASEPTSAGSRAEWAGLVTACQSLANTATAVQDVAITRLAAIEEEWLEDGTTAETRRAPGHVALDAPDIVAGALGVSHVHAQRRVGLAVRLVADSGVGGADAGGRCAVGATGLAALHAAMVDGDLDAYRAGVVAEELTEAPPEVAEAVVGVLVPYVDVETAVQLRRRCRRALARISPDLLRQRAKRAREACGLRRWVDEPGVDRWEGTFPSEQAAEGWAAVDALAQRYVAAGRCRRVDAARAQALMDLIRAQATIDVRLVVTVPATSTQRLAPPCEGAGSSLPTDSPPGKASPLRSPLEASASSLPSPRSGPAGTASAPSPDTRVTPPVEPLPPAVAPSPKCVNSSASPSGPPPAAAPSVTTTPPAPVAVVPGSAEDLVEVVGLVPGEPVLVHRGWVESVQELGTVAPTQCHPRSGALLDRTSTAATSYRPSRRLAALVRARDGRCRFPGCSVAARFCDLDHVRPWPAGPTTAANLMCLCRRHHRIKQRPGWSVRLLPDARAVWSDPTGRIRVSDPRDLLDLVVLPAPTGRSFVEGHAASDLTPLLTMGPAEPPIPAPASPPLPESDGPAPRPSAPVDTTPLEVLLGVLGDHGPPRRPDAGRGSRRDRLVHRAPPLPGCRVRYVDGRVGHAPNTQVRRGPAGPGVLRETGPPPF